MIRLGDVVRLLPTAEEVAAFLQWDESDADKIQPHLTTVTAMVKSYTRGNGFGAFGTLTDVHEDVAAVIISATARSVTNPAQVVREEVGTWSVVPNRADGFTLPEQFVLNGYRRRSA